MSAASMAARYSATSRLPRIDAVTSFVLYPAATSARQAAIEMMAIFFSILGRTVPSNLLSRLAHPLDFRVERDETFGNDPDVVAQALSDNVKVPARGTALLPNFLSNFPPERRLRSLDLRANGGEFLFDVSVHWERRRATILPSSPGMESRDFSDPTRLT